MSRKTFWIIFSIAAALRIFMIGRAPLWYDENFTLILARLPLDKMLDATAGDVHPPLWYLIEWMFYHALPSLPAWAIRIPALTFSLLAFVMFVKLCDILHIPERVTIAASVLMAILPMQIWYAQEGRMYALLEFLVLASLYAGLTRRWLYFFLASLGMVYTQNYGVFYLAVIAFVLLVTDWDSLFDVIYALAQTAVLYMPWVFVIANQMTEISGRYWIMDISAGGTLKTIYQQFWSSSMMDAGIVPAYVVTFIALIIGVYALLSEKVIAWWTVITMAFAPLGIALIASLLWQPLLITRPLIGTAPFLYLIVCWPLTSKTVNLRTFIYAACFIVPVYMFGLGGYYSNIADMKGEGAISPLLGALAYVRENWHDGDVLYYADDGPMVNLMPYAADLPQYRMPACTQSVLGSLSDTTRAALGSRIAELDDVTYTRAWVFAPRSPLHPQCYDEQIATIAPEGTQLITVDENIYLSSGIWLVEK